jgi:DNA-binding winged helix-turn-helix (wHTH) protein/TolB-like protein/Flp pilus assembly protein TadD
MSKLAASRHTYSFSDFTLDLARGCLLREGEEVKLRPKVFDALKYLVENNNRLVTKAELIEAVWSESFVTDDSLVQCIVELRRALGDDAQQYIKTVPRRGYIFDAIVTGEPSAGEPIYAEQVEGIRIVIEEEDKERFRNAGPMEADALVLPAISPPMWLRGKSARTVLMAALLLASLAIGLLYFWRSDKSKQAAPATQVRSIAVLPFKPLSADGGDEYLGLGMADTLITKLTNLRQIIVRPTGAVRKYMAPDQDPLAAGREQRVDAVLEGSIQRQDEKVRLTVRLLNVQDGSPLWAYKCEEYCTDIFSLEDAISERVAGALALELTSEERKLLTKRYTENAEAYQLYLKGRYFLNKRTAQGIQKAIEYFQQALELDQNDALAFSGLADCYLQSIYFTSKSPNELISKGRALARKALEIDETLGEAHALHSILIDAEWDWNEALKEGQLAIGLSPGSARAHHLFAFILVKQGRFDEALAEITKAKDFDPLNLVISADIAEILRFAGRYDEAIEQCHKTLELDPNFSMAYAHLGFAYLAKGLYKEALGPLQRAVELEGEGSVRMIQLAIGYGFAGQKDKAQEFLRKLKKRAKTEYVDPMWIAGIYAAIGARDEALDWIEKAYDERSPTAPALLVDSRFKTLRSEPRYQAVLSRMGLARQ